MQEGKRRSSPGAEIRVSSEMSRLPETMRREWRGILVEEWRVCLREEPVMVGDGRWRHLVRPSRCLMKI